MASKRLCEFKDHFDKRFKGIFHRWGDSYIMGERNEEIPLTVAIVEVLATGEVMTLRPAEVKFLPPPMETDSNPESLRILAMLADK